MMSVGGSALVAVSRLKRGRPSTFEVSHRPSARRASFPNETPLETKLLRLTQLDRVPNRLQVGRHLAGQHLQIPRAEHSCSCA